MISSDERPPEERATEEHVREAREALNRQAERPAAQPEKGEPDNRKLNIVTGAFGYTGHYISKMLLADGQWVETITNGKYEPRRNGPEHGPEHSLEDFNTEAGPESNNQAGSKNAQALMQSYPYSFRDPKKLVNALHGCDTLYNTYWARLAQGPQEFTQAVRNSQILIKAARMAGVRRFVHISAMNPQGSTELPYFRSKDMVEQYLRESGLSYAIIRPGLIFGQDDLFLNNLAWMIRRSPVLAIPGDGKYRIQPVEVGEFARMAILAGTESEDSDNYTADAAGPEIHTFNTLVDLLAQHVQKKPRILHLSHKRALMINNLAGKFMLDMPLGDDESKTLASDLLISDNGPSTQVKLSEWLASNKFRMGLVQTHQPARNRED